MSIIICYNEYYYPGDCVIDLWYVYFRLVLLNASFLRVYNFFMFIFLEYIQHVLIYCYFFIRSCTMVKFIKKKFNKYTVNGITVHSLKLELVFTVFEFVHFSFKDLL